MTVLRRLGDPRLRPAWTGLAAAAALAAFIMTGAVFWFLHPWRFAGLLVLLAVLLGIWHGTFTRHSDRGIRASRQERGLARAAARASAGRAKREAAEVIAAIEARRPAIEPAPDDGEKASMGKLRGTAGQRAGYWPMGTDVISYDDDPPPPWFSPIPGPPDPPVVTVTDDPPRGKHEKPRTYLVHSEPPPYCARCGSDEHWTKDHAGPDPLVTQMVADRAASRARHAIDDDLRKAGFKVYPGGEDDAVKSMFTRAMASAIAAVEAARKP